MEKVLKVPENFITTDGINVMVPYEKKIALFNSDGLLLSDKEEKSLNPFFGLDIKYINHLFGFDKPYILVKDGLIKQYTVTSLEKECYVIETELPKQNVETDYTSKKDYYSLFRELMATEEGESVFLIDSEGRFLDPCSEDEYFAELLKFIRQLEENHIPYKYDKYQMSYLTKGSIPNHLIDLSSPIYIIKTNGSDIKIKFVKPLIVCKNNVALNIGDMPINSYSLEEIANLINSQPKPKSKTKTL